MHEFEIEVLKDRQRRNRDVGDVPRAAQLGVLIAFLEAGGPKDLDRFLAEIGESVPKSEEERIGVGLQNWVTRAGAATDATQKLARSDYDRGGRGILSKRRAPKSG